MLRAGLARLPRAAVFVNGIELDATGDLEEGIMAVMSENMQTLQARSLSLHLEPAVRLQHHTAGPFCRL